MEKLAIFGGEPVRETPIYYGRQFIDDDDVAAVVETLKSDLITCGPKVEELEQKLCELTEAKYERNFSILLPGIPVYCWSLPAQLLYRLGDRH